jgi:PhzF family phenazine biosynthesis protein
VNIPIAIVDAFTTTRGQGNRAGVVTQTRGLDAAAMQRAASAVAASETAFVFRDGDSIRLRYFTPEAEIPFCGHATVAALHYLAETGEDPGPGRIEVQCGIGPLAIELDEDRIVWIDAGDVEWSECGDALEHHVLAILEPPPLREFSLPVLKSRGMLYVPLARRDDLWRLTPDWDRLSGLKSTEDIMGVYAFTLETVESGSISHARFFAPAVGIREDPVTGAASVPLADYLARFGILELPPGGGTVRGRAEQGDAMGKPGRVELEATGAPGKIDRVRIGGRAVTVLEGNLKS